MSGVVISINSPGGTTTGAEELFRNIRQLAGEEAASSPSSTARRRPAATSRRSPPTASSRARPRSSARSACILQYPQVSRPPRQARRPGRGGEVEPAQGRAERPSGRRRRRRARRCSRSSTTPTTGSSDSSRRGAATTDSELGAVADGRVFNGRQALALEARRRARRRARGDRLARAREGRRQGPAGARLEARAATRGFSLFCVGGDRRRPLSASRDLARQLAPGRPSAPKRAQLDGLLAVWHPAVEK